MLATINTMNYPHLTSLARIYQQTHSLSDQYVRVDSSKSLAQTKLSGLHKIIRLYVHVPNEGMFC